MKFTFFFFSFFLLSTAFADSFRSKIDSIDRGVGSEPTLIKFENGRVAFVSSNIKSFLQTQVEGSFVQVKLDKEFNLLSVSSVEAPKAQATVIPSGDTKLRYTPTNLGSVAEAQTIFNRMNRGYQGNSQCYNRAHIWAYEENKRTGFNSMKLFMFFTSRYIRNYRYKWWFHVTPMTYVNGVPMALDRRYTRTPRTIKNWTDDFIYSRRECPVVNRYADYRNNQESQDCYLIPVSQYFWQPRDIDNRDRTGASKTSFIAKEISHAYWEAF